MKIDTAFEIDEAYRNISYKTFNLYDVCKYSICNELKCFDDEISVTRERHKICIKKWYGRAAAYIEYAENMFRQDNPDIVCLLRGNFVESFVIKKFAEQTSCLIFTLEGSLRKDRLRIDDVTKEPDDDRSVKLFIKNFQGNSETKKIMSSNLSGAIIKQPKLSQHQTPDAKYVKKSCKPLLLFLGQVYTDASLIYGMEKAFRNPIDLLGEFITLGINEGYEVVVKLHPKENKGTDPVANKPYGQKTWKMIRSKYAQEIEGCPLIEIDYTNQFNTYDLIKSADIVFTINSQSGLEALVMKKPVVMFGKNYYDNLKGVEKISDFEAMRRLFDRGFDGLSLGSAEEAPQFYCSYLFGYCVKRDENGLLSKLLKKTETEVRV